MIEIRDISKKYRETFVLRHVSTRLPSDRMVAFIGSNGAGKSTMLNIISRLLEPTEGSGNSGNGIPGSLPKPSPSWGKPSILRRGSRSRNWFASDVSLIPAAAWKIRIFCKSKRLWNLPRFPICAIATLMNFRAASGRWPILPWPLHRTRSTSFSMNL